MEHSGLTADSSITLQEVTDDFTAASITVRMVIIKHKLLSLFFTKLKPYFNLRVFEALADFRSLHPDSSVEASGKGNNSIVLDLLAPINSNHMSSSSLKEDLCSTNSQGRR